MTHPNVPGMKDVDAHKILACVLADIRTAVTDINDGRAVTAREGLKQTLEWVEKVYEIKPKEPKVELKSYNRGPDGEKMKIAAQAKVTWYTSVYEWLFNKPPRKRGGEL